MLEGSPADVFTAAELALAAGAPRSVVDALIERDELGLVAGTHYIAGSEAVRAGRRLRGGLRDSGSSAPSPLFSSAQHGGPGSEPALPAFLSTGVHAVLLLLAVWVTTGQTETASIDASRDDARLVFVVSPGPGGGGGGGGLRNAPPARKLERRGTEQARLSVPPPPPAPQPLEPIPEPPPAPAIVAPVVAVASAPQEAQGVIVTPRPEPVSQGSGAEGGAGTGQGAGNGEGTGSGIGDGTGGGTGGGPYHPGSGIEPPRLLKEVKADYTDDARRRNIAGDVILEIVVRRDGTVGEVTVRQGLGAGLDQRAVAAVRQWRFAPAVRKGVPVDVIVEVAVEFTLR